MRPVLLAKNFAKIGSRVSSKVPKFGSGRTAPYHLPIQSDPAISGARNAIRRRRPRAAQHPRLQARSGSEGVDPRSHRDGDARAVVAEHPALELLRGHRRAARPHPRRQHRAEGGRRTAIARVPTATAFTRASIASGRSASPSSCSPPWASRGMTRISARTGCCAAFASSTRRSRVVVTYDRSIDGGDIAPFDCGAVTNALVNAAWSRGLGCVINSQGIMQSPVVREHAGIADDQVIMICVAHGLARRELPGQRGRVANASRSTTRRCSSASTTGHLSRRALSRRRGVRSRNRRRRSRSHPIGLSQTAPRRHGRFLRDLELAMKAEIRTGALASLGSSLGNANERGLSIRHAFVRARLAGR